MSYALAVHQVHVMECARIGRPPWDCFPRIVDAIACVNELVKLGFIEEDSGNYSLTDAGRAVLDTHIAMQRLRPTPGTGGIAC